MNVSLAEVLAGAAQHAVPLTAECVGYLVLGAADQVIFAPRSVGAGDLMLSEDGAVRVAGGRAAGAEDAERDLRAVLDALLVRASSASPGLLRASRRPPGSGLEGFVRELETALIPVNRAAAKRALSRLQRETRRALDNGRIRLDESVPPPAPAPRAAPPAPQVVVAQGVVAQAEPSVVAAPSAPPPEVSASEPLPSVALPPVMTELAPPVMTEAAPPVMTEDASPLAERREHTTLLSEVAPREPEAPLAPQLVETRPEPVVRRASQRPPAPIRPEFIDEAAVERGNTARLPPVAAVPENVVVSELAVAPGSVVVAEPAAAGVPVSSTAETPVLGTRFAAEELPNVEVPLAAAAPEADDESELEIVVVEDLAADAAGEGGMELAAAAEDDDGLIEVIFEEDDRTVFPEDHELEFVDAAPADAGETTDPCPPLAAESMLPPPCEAVTAEPGEVVAAVPLPVLPKVEPIVEAAPKVEPIAEAAPKVEPIVAAPPLRLPSDVELAVLVESALPPWICEEAPVFEVTPPPRVALPEPRQSDVHDLIRRLGEAPLGVDELRSGLKRLAGLEPTPPPPGTRAGD